MRLLALVALVAACVGGAWAAKDDSSCEVCVAGLKNIEARVKDKTSLTQIEDALEAYCAKPPSVRGVASWGRQGTGTVAWCW